MTGGCCGPVPCPRCECCRGSPSAAGRVSTLHGARRPPSHRPPPAEWAVAASVSLNQARIQPTWKTGLRRASLRARSIVERPASDHQDNSARQHFAAPWTTSFDGSPWSEVWLGPCKTAASSSRSSGSASSGPRHADYCCRWLAGPSLAEPHAGWCRPEASPGGVRPPPYRAAGGDQPGADIPGTRAVGRLLKRPSRLQPTGGPDRAAPFLRQPGHAAENPRI